MYTENQFLKHFLLILIPAAFYQSLPFLWNRKTKQIENAIKSPHQKKIYKFKCNLHVFLTAFIIVQVTLANSQNPSTKAMCTFTVAMLFLTTVVVKEYSNWDQEAISLLNRFIWSSREMTAAMDSYERHRKIAVDLLNPGTFFFPLLYTIGVALRLPCLPSNFGYWMHPECLSSTNTPINQLHPLLNLCIRIMLASINFWIWSFGMHATCVVGSGVVMIGLVIHLFNRNLFKHV